MNAAEIAGRLEAFLKGETGAKEVSVSGFRSMTGGATRRAFACDLDLEWMDGRQARHEAVLLVFRPAGQQALGAREEFNLLRAVHRHGVPVPTPLFVGDEALGRPFYLATRISGESIGRRIVRDEAYAAARTLLPTQLARALAAIHSVAVEDEALAALPGAAGKGDLVEAALNGLGTLYRQTKVEEHPVFELALRWLENHRPSTSRRALVHGDFRIGNIMVDASGLRAVLDWELAHIGDPLEDLGWLCGRSWRFGRPELSCGGVGSREALAAAYQEATATPVDPEALRFWEIFGNLRWGVFTLVQLRAFIEGISRDIELAMIGRRTAETEWELLGLIEGKEIA